MKNKLPYRSKVRQLLASRLVTRKVTLEWTEKNIIKIYSENKGIASSLETEIPVDQLQRYNYDSGVIGLWHNDKKYLFRFDRSEITKNISLGTSASLALAELRFRQDPDYVFWCTNLSTLEIKKSGQFYNPLIVAAWVIVPTAIIVGSMLLYVSSLFE